MPSFLGSRILNSNWLALSLLWHGRSSEHEGGLGKSQGRTFKDGRCGDQRKGMRAQRGLASRSVFAGVFALARCCPSLKRLHESQVHDLYDYEPQPYLLGFQNEERIKRNGLKKTDFDFKSLIGVSMFGHISMAKHKMSGTFVAIKCLSKKEIMRLKQVDSIYLEKEVLTFLNHPMIIRGGGSFQDASTLYLVTELCPGGDLFTLIARQPSRRLDEGPAKFYAAGVAMALSYLHVRDLIYRALNSENVLIDAKGYIKICDFQQVAGILRRPNKGRNEFTKKRLKRKEFWTVAQHPGPELVQKTQREGLNTTAFEHMRRRFVPHYFAPEVVSLGRHGKETDWWCFGVLVYEMLVGYPPFYDADPPGLFDKICRSQPEFPVFIMPLAKDFMVKTMLKDRIRRLGHGSTEEVLRHHWFRSFTWQRFMYRKIRAPWLPDIMGPSDTSMFESFTDEGIDDHTRRFDTAEKTLGDVFDRYSDPEAEPLTQLPPKHLMYYNLGMKIPGEEIEEEATPRSDEDEEEGQRNGNSDVIEEMDDEKQKIVDSFIEQFGMTPADVIETLNKHKWDEDKASAFLEMKQEEDAKLAEKQQEKETDGFRD